MNSEIPHGIDNQTTSSFLLTLLRDQMTVFDVVQLTLSCVFCFNDNTLNIACVLNDTVDENIYCVLCIE